MVGGVKGTYLSWVYQWNRKEKTRLLFDENIAIHTYRK